ncbi:MAG: hypothetical protein ABIQ57_13640 [Candidatus Kapaibacterium sp.]
MAVNRCLCHGVPFAAALAIAGAHGCATVAALQNFCALGTGCGLCVPYMQRSLATGETDLPVLGNREMELWTGRSGIVTEGRE